MEIDRPAVVAETKFPDCYLSSAAVAGLGCFAAVRSSRQPERSFDVEVVMTIERENH